MRKEGTLTWSSRLLPRVWHNGRGVETESECADDREKRHRSYFPHNCPHLLSHVMLCIECITCVESNALRATMAAAPCPAFMMLDRKQNPSSPEPLITISHFQFYFVCEVLLTISRFLTLFYLVQDFGFIFVVFTQKCIVDDICDGGREGGSSFFHFPPAGSTNKRVGKVTRLSYPIPIGVGPQKT
jgi:hypothetical protein